MDHIARDLVCLCTKCAVGVYPSKRVSSLTVVIWAECEPSAVPLQLNSVCVQNEFFPRWDEVKAEHVKPGILHIIADLEKELSTLEESVQPTWKGLVEPLERISDRISRAWGTVSHLKVR